MTMILFWLTVKPGAVAAAGQPRRRASRKSWMTSIFTWNRPDPEADPDDWDSEDWERLVPPDLDIWWPEAATEEDE